jgi:geranylgeranyl diphosphate synthase type II
MLRPSLCIATAQSRSARPRGRRPLGRRARALHNAFLVHDDIEDESDDGRGRPTLHSLHGVAAARERRRRASRSSACRRWSTTARRLGTALTVQVLDEAGRMARESIEGQAVELGWRRDNTLSSGRRLPRDGPQEDVLVHDDLPEPRRSADRHRRAAAPDRSSASASSSAPHSRSRTTC